MKYSNQILLKTEEYFRGFASDSLQNLKDIFNVYLQIHMSCEMEICRSYIFKNSLKSCAKLMSLIYYVTMTITESTCGK